MRKLILFGVPALAVAVAAAKKRGVFEDKMFVATNRVGKLCIHHPQRWKVWRRGKHLNVQVHFTPASDPTRHFHLRWDQVREFMTAAMFGERGAITFAEEFGVPCTPEP